MKSEKTHVFGFVTSLLFTGFTVGGFSLVLYVKYDIVDFETTLYSGMLLFLISFLVLQQRIKRFIYKRVRKIYEELFGVNGTTVNPNKSVLVGGAPSKSLPVIRPDGTPVVPKGKMSGVVTASGSD